MVLSNTRGPQAGFPSATCKEGGNVRWPNQISHGSSRLGQVSAGVEVVLL